MSQDAVGVSLAGVGSVWTALVIAVISAGHAFVQNLRRGHYELGIDLDPRHRLPAAFAELAIAV